MNVNVSSTALGVLRLEALVQALENFLGRLELRYEHVARYIVLRCEG
jgi:hypothetical protein